MFTGLIREIAIVKSYKLNQLEIQCKYKPKVGDSIAINGICLTASKIENNGFWLDVSDETINKSSIKQFRANMSVHIEPALKINDRIEGHILQGHIDTIGKIEKIEKMKFSYDVYISFCKESRPFIAPKGSIAIDGISLTINEVFQNSCRLSIIPHTFVNTLFFSYKVGDFVNIETDFFAKYIYHMLQNKGEVSKQTMTWEDIDNISYQY